MHDGGASYQMYMRGASNAEKLVFEGKMTGVVFGLKQVTFLADELDKDTYYLFVGAAMVY